MRQIFSWIRLDYVCQNNALPSTSLPASASPWMHARTHPATQPLTHSPESPPPGSAPCWPQSRCSSLPAARLGKGGQRPALGAAEGSLERQARGEAGGSLQLAVCSQGFAAQPLPRASNCSALRHAALPHPARSVQLCARPALPPACVPAAPRPCSRCRSGRCQPERPHPRGGPPAVVWGAGITQVLHRSRGPRCYTGAQVGCKWPAQPSPPLFARSGKQLAAGPGVVGARERLKAPEPPMGHFGS